MIDCVTEKFVKRHELIIAPDDDNMIELIAAEGNVLKVTDTTTLESQLPVALVCPKLSHKMLLSWITQKKLNMIHKGWPFTVINYYTANSVSMSELPTTPQKLCPAEPNTPPTSPAWPPPHFPTKLQELCVEFEDVLDTELEVNQHIQCQPMEVELVGGTKPFFARRPHKNPLHLADKQRKRYKNS